MSPAAPSSNAAIFAALGDPTRLRLVARLCGGGPMVTRLKAAVEED